MLDHPKLTARQQQILDLIQAAISRTGAPPTRAEIANTLGFKSANAAEEHLQALARKGVIELVSGTSRGIRLRTDTVRNINAARGTSFGLPLSALAPLMLPLVDRKSTRLNSSHQIISYAVFCLKKKKNPLPTFMHYVSPELNSLDHSVKLLHLALAL